jgi:epoxyqueuosine reductase QueG
MYAPALPYAVSLVMRFRPAELDGLEGGPTEAYHAAYRRLNEALEHAASTLATGLREAGRAAEHVEPTVPEDRHHAVEDWTDARVFPHKTAATRAGLGWIGKTALFVSPTLGPRVRLATVFTDLPLEAGLPVGVGHCGACRRCVDACPARAGRDVTWRAGMPRAALYDAKACELETELYPELGGVCGVCMAVCPRGAPAMPSEPGA